MELIRKNKLTVAGIILGALTGYLYYHFYGCSSGTCAITSKPLNSTIYGALMGGLLLNTFSGNKMKANKGADE